MYGSSASVVNNNQLHLSHAPKKGEDVSIEVIINHITYVITCKLDNVLTCLLQKYNMTSSPR